MPIGKADYELGFKLTGEGQVKGTLEEITAQYDALKQKIAQAQSQGKWINEGDMSKLDSLGNAIENYKGKIVQFEASGHEVRHGLHLTAEALGEIAPGLGGIARLAPMASAGMMFLIPAAVLEGIKMLNQQLTETREHLLANIKATMDLHDAFEINLRNATYHVTEQIHEFRRAFASAGEVQNEFAERLREETSVIEHQTTAATSLAEARRQLYEANIQGGQLTGELTGPEAHADEEHARRQEREQAEAEEARRHREDVAEQRRLAAAAATEAGLLQDQATSQNRTDRRVANEAAVESQEDEVKRRKDAADKVKEEVVSSGFGSDVSAAHIADIKAEVEQLKRQAMRTDLPEGEAGAAAGQAAGLEQQLAKVKEYQDALGLAATAEKHLSEIKITAADFEAETTRMQSRAESLKAWAEQTNQAADSQERLNNATEAAHGPRDQTSDETERQRRRNQLLERQQSDRATPDEQAEASGAFDRNPRAAITDIERRIQAIGTHARIFEGGHVSAEEFRQLQELNDRLIGLMENVLVGSSGQGIIGMLSDRIDNLERSSRNLAQRLNSAPNPM